MSRSGTLGSKLYRGEISIDFIGKRRRWYAFSGALIVISAIALSFQGLHLGIEFKGGASFSVKQAGVTVAAAQEAIASTGIKTEVITQTIGTDKVQVQTGVITTAESQMIQDALAAKFNVNSNSIDTQLVGPSWGADITHKALYGLFAFLFVVVLFLSLAFEPKMAIAAIIAVVHDLLITVGIYALVGFDVTPATVIGFLTILGYSLYDTVVVFDKVRENTRGLTGGSRMTYSQAANHAINQTLVRSMNTSLIALLPVASILFVGAGLLGAGTLKDLSLALFVGLATGTYSSIFVATPILASLHEREPAMQALSRRVASKGNQGTKANGETDAVLVETKARSSQTSSAPRNQPKRKNKKKR
ncbi:MAG TPA: protein translocase subunit SecF [Candidatus Nanopelagicaceae bacterium]|nr:protein translocase subunit SecF [Candidatus Nanopelagicaceae bacterium]